VRSEVTKALLQRLSERVWALCVTWSYFPLEAYNAVTGGQQS